MKNKSAILSILGMAIASLGPFESHPKQRRREPSKTPLPDKIPLPPTGTKQYFFNEQGEYSTEKMPKSECVFICHAINDKNAIRKFKKWLTSNKP